MHVYYHPRPLVFFLESMLMNAVYSSGCLPAALPPCVSRCAEVNCTEYQAKGEAACDAVPDCAWCKCKAVPSVCVTLEQAKK